MNSDTNPKEMYVTKVDNFLSGISRLLKQNEDGSENNRLSKENKNNSAIASTQFSNLKSTGGTIPRLYGLPNLHKVGLPDRFILDMAGMEQYCESKPPLYGVLLATRNNGLI
ncbi:unnamed protein product [Schistosoma intercalatum]|nr:unnamed protein product [Schistosoma intercalatum]